MSASGGARRRLALARWWLACWCLAGPRAALAMDDPLRTLPPSMNAIGAAPCPAGRDAGVALTLAAAVDLALCRDPQIREAWINIKIQAGALGEARAAFLPRLSAGVGRVGDSTSGAGGASRGSVRSTTLHAGLDWRLVDFGARAANEAAAEALLLASQARHQAAVQTALGAVVQTYFDAIAARAALDAKRQSEQMADETVAAAARREAQGVIGHADTLQARTALAKATIEKNRARGAWMKAVALLTYAIGEPESRPPLLPDWLEGQAPQSEPDLDQWLEQIRREHPSIVSARAQLQAARSQVAALRSEALPTLDLSINYYRNGRPDQSLQAAGARERTVGLMLTVPIFDGFATSYRVAGALAQAEHREVELDQTEHQVLTEVVKAHADATSSLDNVAASASLQSAALEALASSRRRYDRGVADILEILAAQTALADARQERVRCLAEWRGAHLRLLASMARMGPGSVGPAATW